MWKATEGSPNRYASRMHDPDVALHGVNQEPARRGRPRKNAKTAYTPEHGDEASGGPFGAPGPADGDGQVDLRELAL